MRILKFLCVICLMTVTTLPARAANLPAGYTELEYIESTGTQYIDTGINLTSNYNVEIKFNGSNQAGFLFGGRTSSSAKDYGLYLNDARSCQPNFDHAQGVVSVADYNDIDTIIKYQNKSFYWGNDLMATYTENFTCDYSCYLFAMNNGGSVHAKTFIGKIYYTKIWNGDTPVRDFIPAKNSSGVVGMYDTVNDVFYTNQGSGTFTAGPVVLNPCRNLLNTATSITGAFIAADGSLTSNDGFSRSDLIPVEPNTKYIVSGHSNTGQSNRRLHAYDTNGNWLAQLGWAQTPEAGTDYTISATTTANTKYVKLSYRTDDTNVQIELGDTATDYVPYCSTGIKIATTKYTEDAFAGLVATLSEAITKVTNIVDTTVQQATEIGNLATTKQDRPDTDCPAGRKCLLIMGADNKPHWYLIQE